MDHIRDHINEEVVNEVLTKELLNMSLDARNAMQEEMHGVKCSAIPETTELLSRSLDEFQREIDRTESDVPSAVVIKKKVYNIILSRRQTEIEQIHNHPVSELNKVYSTDHYAIDDVDFRLRFLRVELFDVPKAVCRFLNYLNYAYESWGEVTLERPICIKDLLNNKEEAKKLRQGHIQVLPTRDRSGRKVTFTAGQSMQSDPKQQELMYKVCFYTHDASTRDCIDDQRMGVVTCFQMHGMTTHKVPYGTFQAFKKLLDSIPVRHVAYHISMPDKPFFHWVKNMMTMKGTDRLEQSLRLVTVVGSEQECRYQQNTFGIPTQLYPSTTTGTIKRTYHKQWMKVRQLKEEKYFKYSGNKLDPVIAENIVECPLIQDVVFRKGTPSLDHFGNVVFRDLMLGYLEERDKSGVGGSRTNENSNKYKNSNDFSAAADSRVFPDRVVPSSQDIVEPKIVTSYGDKEDQKFCDQLIEGIEINRKGRFLEWNQSLSTWICMKSNPEKNVCKIRQKILIAIYHCRRKQSKSLLPRKKTKKVRRNFEPDDPTTKPNNSDATDRDDGNYQFVEGGQRALDRNNGGCCDFSTRADTSKKRKPNSTDRST